MASALEAERKKDEEALLIEITGPSDGSDVAELKSQVRKDEYMFRKRQLCESSLIFKKICRMCVSASEIYTENDTWLNSYWNRQKVYYGIFETYKDFKKLVAFLGSDPEADPHCCSLVPDLNVPFKEIYKGDYEDLFYACFGSKNLRGLLKLGWDNLTCNGTQF